MFITEYLSEINTEILLSKYNVSFINNIDKKLFEQNLNIFLSHGFKDIIEDIIINYLEVFIEKTEYVEDSLEVLIEYLGDNYLNEIKENLYILSKAFDEKIVDE